MAAKKNSEGLAFLVDVLKNNPSTPYADAAEAAKKKGLKVWPIMYGKAKLMLGHVKAGSGATKRAKDKANAKRGPGRPPKAAGGVRRGPGRPPKSAAVGNLDGFVAAVRSSQQDLNRLRSALSKVQELIGSALAQ